MKLNIGGLGLGFNRGGGGSWTPREISNLHSWFDAQNYSSLSLGIGENDLAVSRWIDPVSLMELTSFTETYSPSYDPIKEAIVCNGQHVMSLVHSIDTATDVNLTVIYVLKRSVDLSSIQYLMNHSGSGPIRGYFASGISMAVRGDIILATNVKSDVMTSKYRLILLNHNSDPNVPGNIVGYNCAGSIKSPIDAANSGETGLNRMTTNSIRLFSSNTSGASGLRADIKAVLVINGSISENEILKLREFCNTYYGAE